MSSSAAATFSRRCATDDGAGDQQDVGRALQQPGQRDRPSAWRRAGRRPPRRASDCSGVKPPSGKYGTNAMPCRARAVDQRVVARGGRCCRGSARTRPARSPAPRRAARRSTVLSPRCRISPCCCSSASAVELLGDRAGLGLLEAADAQVDHVEDVQAEVRRLSWTCSRSSAGVRAGGQPPCSSRRAPTLVTMCRSSGYGCSASRISSFVDVRAVVVGWCRCG